MCGELEGQRGLGGAVGGPGVWRKAAGYCLVTQDSEFHCLLRNFIFLYINYFILSNKIELLTIKKKIKVF